MTYDSRRREYSKEHLYVVELDLEYCSLTSGIGPCTATEVGDAKCYNTKASTNDLPNFTPTIKTYRFCEARSPHPIGLDAIPSLIGMPSIAPAQIDLSGGLGIRSSVSLRFRDHPHDDRQFDIDKYADERSFIASDRGTFWTKLRARNPNYQFRNLRVLSGYLVGGIFDPVNFQTRHYVVESMNVTRGRATITAKDPLRLASRKKAQAPAPSTGQISNAGGINAAALSLTLTPAGVGNLEYPASGKVSISSEVMSFTRVADVLTLVRAQNNTVAKDHGQNDTVQLALEFNAQQVNIIAKDLLTNFAKVDASFIPDAAWQAEVDTFLSGLLTGIIVRPTDVWKLLKEVSEQMPHYLWWDERTQEIQLTALKAPPLSANTLDMDSNLVADSVSVKDMPEKRVSTVYVNFGQIDPTKRLDEPNNYLQSYVRVDTESITKFITDQIKVINSRWITSTNKAAALQLAALIGRRFSDIPRMMNFSLDAKDSDVWAGQSRAINHRDVVDFSGVPIDTIFQILSVKEDKVFKYKALEFVYGDELPEDQGGGDPDVDLVILSVDAQNINLRTIYNGLFPAPDASTQAKFIIENGVVIGSASSFATGMDTGSWPAGATITLQLNSGGFAVGKGGDGGGDQSGFAEDGGLAIILNHDLTITNNGVIGGGGGGGEEDPLAGGGGGAGSFFGIAGQPLGQILEAKNGTLETGGAGGTSIGSAGGAGGDLGQPGGFSSGGFAGDAIDKNGFTLTEDVTGDIRGAVIA